MAFFLTTIGIIVAILGVAIFTQFEISDKAYDRLKWLAIRWDYLVVFIGLIVKTFDIVYGLETITIVGGIGALMAGLLGISAKNYYVNGVQTKFNDDEFYEMLEVADENQNGMSEEE